MKLFFFEASNWKSKALHTHKQVFWLILANETFASDEVVEVSSGSSMIYEAWLQQRGLRCDLFRPQRWNGMVMEVWIKHMATQSWRRLIRQNTKNHPGPNSNAWIQWKVGLALSSTIKHQNTIKVLYTSAFAMFHRNSVISAPAYLFGCSFTNYFEYQYFTYQTYYIINYCNMMQCNMVNKLASTGPTKKPPKTNICSLTTFL